MELIRLIKKDKRRLAEAIGVDVSTLYRWLAGAYSPTFEELLALIRVTGDSPADVMAFFEDLISCEPNKSPPDAKKYLKGLQQIRLWKEAFK